MQDVENRKNKSKTKSSSPKSSQASSSISRHSLPQAEMLNSCQKLKFGDDCDKVALSQIVVLTNKDPQSCKHLPLALPSKTLDKLCSLSQNSKAIINSLTTVDLASDSAIRELDFPLRILDRHVARISRERQMQFVSSNQKKGSKTLNDPSFSGRLGEADRKKLIAIAQKHQFNKQAELKASAKLYRKQRDPLQILQFSTDSVVDRVRDLLSRIPSPQLNEAKPIIGFEIKYQQKWCSEGYHRGRLINSIPLAADSSKEIKIKSWQIKKRKREQLESIEQDISTEFIGDEKWSMATTKQLSAQLNQSIDANLKAGAEVPIKAVKVRAEAGAASKTSAAVQGAITNTEERIQQATQKATDSLKKKSTMRIESDEEIGFESSYSQTITNPNKCNSLTYHFFEVIETFQITTQVKEVNPVILLPLQAPSITAEWLLCHQCLIKPHLPCDSFYQGFEAAKMIISRQLLGEFSGNLDSKEISQTSNSTLNAIESLLSTYLTLKNASITAQLSDGAGTLAAGVDEILGKGEEILDIALDTVNDVIDEVEQLGAEIINGFGEVSDFVGGFLFSSNAQIAQSTSVNYAIAHRQGGVGSYIFWQVSEIAAPELGRALAGLQAAYENLQSMPSGAAKTNASINALQTFYTNLGDIDEVFNKIKAGLTILAAGISASSFVGLVTIGIGAGLTVAAATALLGGAIVFSIGEFVLLVIAMLNSDSDIDILPDDEGLKSNISALYGIFQQLGGLLELPVPPQSDAPEERAIYREELQDVKRRRRELADAQVELNRLLCHIKENRTYYSQVYWSSISASDLEIIFATDFAIPAQLLEAKIIGFDGPNAAFRVRDSRQLMASGIDIEKLIAKLHSSSLFSETRQNMQIQLPTRGVTIEPELGECNACDEFIQFHREQDKIHKSESIKQQKIETERLQERINQGLLNDPTPYENASSVSLELDENG